MPEVTEAQVLAALRTVPDPDLGKDLVSLNMIKNVRICEGNVAFVVELTTPACPMKAKIEADCRAAVGAIEGVTNIKVELTANVVSRRAQGGKVLPKVKHVIAIASGKGGVGKSTVTTNLAIALAQAGARVGVMDADVYGPTIPMLLGLEDEQLEQIAERQVDGNVIPKINPLERHGVSCVSVGFMVEAGQPLMLRGPMLGKVVNQFLGDVAWGELDYLLVDMPPGTGDVTISLVDAIPLSGAVIVMTPQDVAASIAVKSLKAFQKSNVPILGIVENMAYFVAPDTGKTYYIFGRSGGQEAAEALQVPFLGRIPLEIATREASDCGEPVLITDPESAQAVVFHEVAGKLAQQISIQARKFRPLTVM
ncbi:Mrp/NBP35 family ATP-binding protein [Armatimonas rosea]|uniref:Iron-sulfur cluster carrier protein n=1 Tax=Armatimonas rosea TaxID=685828 RepID=A0A7W9STU1_ARMRO|nr:Mrp/NBP35 family ATP-binding protein [Armatimonas rosea]MBB6052732.1 ATP-binding protein involved in chromosome partitioning [Armatimonas rosea]